MLKIDTKSIVPVILGSVPSAANLREAARHLGDVARAEWVRLAKHELRSTSRDYIEAIGFPELKRGGKEVNISLNGRLANMIEHGWPGGDMREFLAHAGAPNAKQSKEGHWYNRVPFRHGTPGTGGRNVGPPMNKRIYDTVKNFGAKDRLDPNKMVDPKIAKLVRRKISKWHVSGRYEGMVKRGSQYLTFRTISQASPRGWIHPGIRQRRLAAKVQTFVANIAGLVITHGSGKS